MPDGAARATATAEKAADAPQPVAAETAALERDVATPDVGSVAVVDITTMANRVQRQAAQPVARRDMLSQIQSRYGNRYAEQVIADIRARESQTGETASGDAKSGGESEGTAKPAAGTAAGGAPATASTASGPAPATASGGAASGSSFAESASPAARTEAAGPAIQRLALNWVSSSSDPAEREADATAKKVMRMPGPDGGASANPADGTLHRKPREGGTSDAAEPAPTEPVGTLSARPNAATVDRKSDGEGAVPPKVASGISDSLPSGKPLSKGVRGYMEPRFNADFSNVKVHTGAQPTQLNRAVSARAFTVNNHVFFGENQYNPDSGSGKELIAHELTHTIQQGAAPQGAQGDGIQRSEAPRVSEKSDTKVQRLGISDALDFFADRANLIPGFRMFTIILGLNPINMRSVDRSAANILRALVEFLPGGGLIVMALDNYGVFDRAGTWVEEQINSLAMTGQSIRDSIMEFLDSLGWSDIFDLGGVWQRATRIFTEPIDTIIEFGRGLVDAIIELVQEAILQPLAEQAQAWAGYDLMRGILGFDPISGEDVERTPELLIGGFMKMIGQEEIWTNLQESNAVERAWAWFQGALAGLIAFVMTVPTLFMQALRELTINDLVELPTAISRVIGIFTSAIGEFGAWALQQVLGLLQIIFEVVAPGVMPYIQRAAGAFNTILEDPIGFVGNLVRAGIQGLNQFADHFLGHLRTSLVEWLTGTMSGAGVYIPQAFNLQEIIKFALSVLGLTWDNIREKLVRRIGEPAVVVLETGFDLVLTLVRDGPAAAWEKIVESVSNLRDMVMEQIMTFVTERVVQAAITKLVTSLNPAGAVIQAIIATYNTIMFFVERLRQIAQVAMAFIDSISAIASGVVTEAANRVEQTMAGLLTLVISFLARIAGLGRVSDAVVRIIDRIRAPIDNALERVVDWIVNMARRVGGFIAQAGVPTDPDERLQAGKEAALAVVNRFAGRPVGNAVLVPLLAAIKVRYGFTRLEVVAREGRWHLIGEINPNFDEATESLTPESLEPSEEGQTVLMGEGNFTFAYSIAAKTEIGNRLIATDFMVRERQEMQMTTAEEQRNSLVQQNIARLEAMGVDVVRQVDATDAGTYPSGSSEIIVFNHPLVLTKDEEGKTIRGGERENIRLITNFLATAKQQIQQGGEIIIISSQYRLKRWKLDEIARQLSLEQHVRHFIASEFPGYTHEMTMSGEGADTVTSRNQFAISFSVSASVER